MSKRCEQVSEFKQTAKVGTRRDKQFNGPITNKNKMVRKSHQNKNSPGKDGFRVESIRFLKTLYNQYLKKYLKVEKKRESELFKCYPSISVTLYYPNQVKTQRTTKRNTGQYT